MNKRKRDLKGRKEDGPSRERSLKDDLRDVVKKDRGKRVPENEGTWEK